MVFISSNSDIRSVCSCSVAFSEVQEFGITVLILIFKYSYYDLLYANLFSFEKTPIFRRFGVVLVLQK